MVNQLLIGLCLTLPLPEASEAGIRQSPQYNNRNRQRSNCGKTKIKRMEP
jgi:hypothetical protein